MSLKSFNSRYYLSYSVDKNNKIPAKIFISKRLFGDLIQRISQILYRAIKSKGSMPSRLDVMCTTMA